MTLRIAAGQRLWGHPTRSARNRSDATNASLDVSHHGLCRGSSSGNFYRPLIWGGVLLEVIAANHFSKNGSLVRFAKRKGQSS